MRISDWSSDVCSSDLRRSSEQGCDHLILNDAVTAQQPDAGIEQKQANGLAVPDVHIGDGAVVQYPVADQQIELLVHVKMGNAKITPTQREGRRDQNDGRRNPGDVAAAARRQARDRKSTRLNSSH